VNTGEILPTITNGRFEQYAGIWFLCSEAKLLWKARVRETKDPALERRWMFFYALGGSVRSSFKEQGKDVESALRGLGNPTWLKQDQDGSVKRVIGRHCRVAFKSLMDAYKEASKQSGFMHRNWFRSLSTIASINEHIMSSWSLLSDHGEDYLFLKAK
jgi:hypothetical protein